MAAVTVASIIIGVTWGMVHVIMSDKNRREHVVDVSVRTIGRLAASNPQLMQLTSSLGTALFRVGSSVEKTREAATLNDGKIFKIPFSYRGGEYTLLVPHDSRKARGGKKMMYRSADGQLKEMSHYMGIPFLVTGEQLGYEVLEVDEELDVD